jgi:hypothetical protein
MLPVIPLRVLHQSTSRADLAAAPHLYKDTLQSVPALPPLWRQFYKSITII